MRKLEWTKNFSKWKPGNRDLLLSIAFGVLILIQGKFEIGAYGQSISSEPQAIGIPHKLTPCEWNYQESRCIKPGVYMDDIINMKIGDVLYKVPAIYFSSWPSIDWVGKITTDVRGASSGLEVSFWMPTRRSEEIKTVPPMVLAALLERGARPKLGEYPVVVLRARFVRPDDPDLILPERKAGNLFRRLSGPRDQLDKAFGLQKFLLEKDVLHQTYYRSPPGSSVQVLMDCTPSGVPAPDCAADIYFNEEQLSFHVRFPKREVENWNEIAVAVRDLMVSWRQK